ncbi:hypothetical protein BDZ89DRAFT_1060117 [Hymenopellis radicata]|nr:hypothetical protein BDZ89DRAFT_1060117 [Hymenopellis radicata]
MVQPTLAPAQPPAARPPYPFPTQYRHQTAILQCAQHFSKQLAGQPEIVAANNLHILRTQCEQLRQTIMGFYATHAGMHTDDPRRHEVVNRLVLLRTEYNLRFWRLFRINDLPSEIILEILRLAVWSDSNGARVRLAVSSTCRMWRELSLGDQSLWTAIMINTSQYPFDRAFAWLDRAGRSSLHIRFDDVEKDKIDNERMNMLLDRLFANVYQIEVLVMIIFDWEPLLTLVKRVDEVARRGRPLILKRFEVHRRGDLYEWPGIKRVVVGHEEVTRYPVIGGPVVPKLDWLCINGIHFEWQASSISNLTTLDLRRLPLELAPTREMFRLILRKCPLLFRLTLDGAGPSRGFDPHFTADPVPLNHLKILLICNFAPGFVKGITQQFSAPNVQDLQLLSFKKRGYGPVYEYMVGMFPKVNILSIFQHDFPDPIDMTSFIAFLASMPKVRYLRISEITPPGIAAFMYDPVTMHPHIGIPNEHRSLFHEHHVPSMSETVIHGDSDTKPVILLPELRYVEVQTFVESRKAIGYPLSKLYLQHQQVRQITPEYVQNLVSNQICAVEPVQVHATTKEEIAVLNDEEFYRLIGV